ncbi:MAG: ABC transporter substrate-binding protein [Alphaproteobacteria bacterium]|nr:ABC transporter substrate-binding protein [Alphaproteobacteria bacterium]
MSPGASTAEKTRQPTIRRRAVLAVLGGGVLASSGVLASRSFGAPRFAAEPGLPTPICTVADQVPAPIVINPRRAIKFAWSGTGVCTSSVPVALHRGYFDKHGLDVEIVNFSGAQDQILESIATGKTDAGVSFALQWLKPLEQGLQVNFTTGVHGGCIHLLAPTKSGITRLDQLRGKTIGVTTMVSASKNFYSIQLAKLGIDPNTDVQWRAFPGDLLGAAALKGDVDVIADADPNVNLLEKRSNGALVTISTNLEGPYRDLSCCVLGIRNSLIRDEKPVAAALTQAILEAAEHVANDPDDAGSVFAKYSPVPGPELAGMLRLHTHHHHPSSPQLVKELAVYIADMKTIGVLKPSTDPDKFATRIYANVFA